MRLVPSRKVLTSIFISKKGENLCQMHTGEAQEQASGMTSSNQNSQLIRVRSNSGSTYDVHIHQQGSYHSRTTN
ncbi:hypothetical protein [Thalassomonas sp. RHCl1]|uniref:hypothetical protein n=1 Tax=Thalassomonas sp. RHCl1 TaxID=2995320 RepID=UPI00248D303D|nr:hypothetical protein [Thalassomonas sp. RHCl1]